MTDPRIVIATPDTVGERMAGPGIRAMWMARELRAHGDVALIAQIEASADAASELAGVPVIARGTPDARRAMRHARVLIGQPSRGFIRRRTGQRIVYDLFDPVVLELRELYGNAPSLRQRIHLGAEWARLVFALRHADLLLCAADSQRGFYERLQPGDTPWLEVPFGIDPGELRACPPPPDNVVLWGGGAWEWLDPATAVDAVVALNRAGVRCRLLFLGRGRPNQATVERRREDRFDDLIRRGEGFVDANSGWIPYRERLSWLRAAKVTIMLHRSTVEARYSVRTRLFDAIAAGVPVVATVGGFAAGLVEREGLGIVVPAGRADAVAAAIRRLLTDDVFHATCVSNLERIRPRYFWSEVMRPLAAQLNRWQID